MIDVTSKSFPVVLSAKMLSVNGGNIGGGIGGGGIGSTAGAVVAKLEEASGCGMKGVV